MKVKTPVVFFLNRASFLWMLLSLASAQWGCTEAVPLSPYEAGLQTQPEQVAFSDTYVGSEIVRNVVVGNDGTAPLRVDAFSLSGADAPFFRIVEQGAFPLESGSSTSIVIAYAPKNTGGHLAQLVLLFSGFDAVTIPLSGSAVLPPLRIEPSEVDWGDLPAGQRALREVEIVNEAATEVRVRIRINGSGAFTLDSGDSSSGSANERLLILPANQSKSLDLFFSPPGAGLSSATLWADVCGEGCGAQAALVGRGLAPRIQLNPRQLDFTEVQVGERKSIALQIQNIGVGELRVSRLSTDDALGFVQILQTPFEPIASGETISFEVEFAPMTPQANFTANLILESNDPLQPRLLIPIRANVPGALARAYPAALQFGLLDVDETRQADTLIRSIGDAPVILNAIVIENDETQAFRISNALPSLPRTLAPQEGFLVEVEAEASTEDYQALGANAELWFRTSAGDFSIPLEFSADISRCRPRATRSHVSLGFIQPGLGARGTTEIVNEGIAPCTLLRILPVEDRPFDAGFTYSSTGLPVINPGETLQVQFAFSSELEGDFRAFLALDFAESETLTVVSASATTLPRSVSAEPSSLQLGPYREGCSIPNSAFLLSNTGATEVEVISILTTPQAPVSFVQPSESFTMAPGSGRSIQFGIPSNLAPGLHSASFRIGLDLLPELGVNLEVEITPADEPLVETFLVPENVNELDVLFIIDNSGSMFDDQVELADNFELFIDAARQASGGLDINLAATTTDVDIEAGRFIGRPPILSLFDPNTPRLFAQRVNVGTTGSPIELGLEAMRLALGPQAPSPNAGFLRRNAALSVVVVSDEDDSGAFLNAGETASVQRYVQFLSSVKSGSVRDVPVLFSAVAPTYASRYTEMVNAFGGISLDILAPWGESLGLIGQASANLQSVFRLAFTPQGRPEVYVNGTLVQDFTLSDNVLTLNQAPRAGSDVRVSYVPIDCNSF